MAKPNTIETLAKQTNRAAPAFSVEALKQIIGTPEAKQLFLELMKDVTKADTSSEMESLTIKAFKRAGYKPENIKPRENIKTYNLWLQDGFRVRPGETSVRVRTLRLFHIDQCEKMNAVEAKKAIAELAAKKAAKGTASKLPPVSPVQATAKPVKGRKPAPAPQATA